MSQELQVRSELNVSEVEKVLITGDLKSLTPEQRTNYYMRVCQALGLNPLTRPLDYLVLNNKLVLYANKGCAEQLRRIYGISIVDMQVKPDGDIVTVIVKARDNQNREDMSSASVVIGGLRGEALANAYMKCETKAKRRLTLSICGLNILDESEVDTIPNAKRVSEESIDVPVAEPAPAIEKPKSSPFGAKIGAEAKKAGIPVPEFVGILFDRLASFYPQLEPVRGKDWRELGPAISAVYANGTDEDREAIEEAMGMVGEFRDSAAYA